MLNRAKIKVAFVLVLYDLWHYNGRIWPFVSGYFAIGVAKHGHSNIFAEEMTALMDLSEQNNTFAEFYNLDKSFPPERRRQLWSDAGFLGMVHQGLFGMRFFEHHLEFAPNKVPGPDGALNMPDTMTLSNVKCRRAILDISVSGMGTKVKSFQLNGEVQENPRIDACLNGRQTIKIEMVEWGELPLQSHTFLPDENIRHCSGSPNEHTRNFPCCQRRFK